MKKIYVIIVLNALVYSSIMMSMDNQKDTPKKLDTIILSEGRKKSDILQETYFALHHAERPMYRWAFLRDWYAHTHITSNINKIDVINQKPILYAEGNDIHCALNYIAHNPSTCSALILRNIDFDINNYTISDLNQKIPSN